jgi:hypothetical protein
MSLDAPVRCMCSRDEPKLNNEKGVALSTILVTGAPGFIGSHSIGEENESTRCSRNETAHHSLDPHHLLSTESPVPK